MQDVNSDQKYQWLVEWYDAHATVVRQYYLYWYLSDATIEMFDVKAGRIFLKRCAYPGIDIKSLFIGAQLVVYCRQLKVVDYADDDTRAAFSKSHTRSLFLTKPNVYKSIGRLIDMIYGNQVSIGSLKMVSLTPSEAAEFLGGEMGPQSELLSSGPCVVIELVGDKLEKLEGLLADAGWFRTGKDSEVATKSVLKAVRCPAQLNNCTACVIKPHAVLGGAAGQIIDAILEKGFEISAMQMFALDRSSVEEFYEVYKGVIPDYHPMVEQLCSGLSIAMEIRGENVVPRFREFCGPVDPELARHIRPGTLRAEFGQDKARNAVHCTDLPEDGVLECEYFFSLLQSS